MTAVIWIDWYPYHVSRLRALTEHESLKNRVTGIELIGGIGVHAGLKFRSDDRDGLPIASLLPEADWRSASAVQLVRLVWRKLQQLQPSAVLVPGYYTAPALAAAVWAKRYGKRCVLMTETTRDDYSRVWWKELPKRLLIRSLFDRAIAGGAPHARYLQELGFPSANIARFYDVVDNEFYRNAAALARRTSGLRESLNLPQNYFLYVGRLAPEKNLETLIEAFAAYCKSGGEWSLVLVGDGPMREQLQAEAAEHRLQDRVRIEGLKTAQQCSSYFAFANCFILPSRREPWGLVVNEAMAAGLPVIVSKHCGCAEDLVKPGVNGYQFDPSCSAELAARMVAVDDCLPSERKSMGEMSSSIIGGYSLQRWAEEVARIVR